MQTAGFAVCGFYLSLDGALGCDTVRTFARKGPRTAKAAVRATHLLEKELHAHLQCTRVPSAIKITVP